MAVPVNVTYAQHTMSGADAATLNTAVNAKIEEIAAMTNGACQSFHYWGDGTALYCAIVFTFSEAS